MFLLIWLYFSLDRPIFEQSDTTNKNDKRNHASTLQLSTRDFVFIIDTKFLIERLSPEAIERFGDVVLFNENLLKLGNLKIVHRIRTLKVLKFFS